MRWIVSNPQLWSLLSHFAANENVRTSSRKERRRQTTGGRDVRTETDDDYDDRLGNGRRTGDDNHGAHERGRMGGWADNDDDDDNDWADDIRTDRGTFLSIQIVIPLIFFETMVYLVLCISINPKRHQIVINTSAPQGTHELYCGDIDLSNPIFSVSKFHETLSS